MTIIAHTDGASRGNPGESGIGIVLRDEHGHLVYSEGRYIGSATNNAAEYQALIACLQKAAELQCQRLVVHSDSELLVRQMTGKYRVRDKGLQQFYFQVHQILNRAPYAFEIVHVARERNRDADLLANAGIDQRLAT
jgi:ribonuclease HI